MRTTSFSSILPSSSSHRRSSVRTARRQDVVSSDNSSSTSHSQSGKMAGGRDSLVADLFWTFHGENANKFADITLISSDNRRFPCCRGILAARSEHFARLLFTDGAPSPTSTLHIDLPGHVLALIVQYLHTGDIASDDAHDRAALDRLLDVARAAHDMSHAALFADCVRHLLDIVAANRAMLCPVFEAFFGEASAIDGASLLAPLLQHVRQDPSAALLIPNLGGSSEELQPPVATGAGVGEPVGVLELSGRALETLIAEDKKAENCGEDVHEEFWFYVAWYWAMHGPTPTQAQTMTQTASSQDGDGTVDESNIKELSIESITRRTLATQILDLLDSRRMRAAFLLKVVEPTGLMSLQKLCEGYKAHATSALKSGIDRKRLRFRKRQKK